MKVETTGDFMLLDIFGGQQIASVGTTEVRDTPFIRQKLDEGQLRDLGASEPKPVSDPSAPNSGRAAAKAK
jgi:hypothetical protein